MNAAEVLKKLQPIFNEVLQLKEVTIEAAMQAKDIENWDSLNHAILIDAIEKKFEVSFDLMDMINMNTVGEICDKVLEKI